MKERIQKILSQRGVASRRQAEQMILEGRVYCNGVVCSLGDSADPACDIIMVDGSELPSAKANVYIVLNKPKGYITTLSDEKGRKNVAMLVADCGQRVYPVGRLDMDSEGILIFTDDGDFANHLMHPKNEIAKTYQVNVKGYTVQNVERLKHPIYLDGYRISPPDVTVLSANGDYADILITIHEGRNRQVRRMCAKAGMTVKRLIRVQEGALSLGDLEPGKWRYLTQDEVRKLWE